jgi:putative transposase
MNLPGLPTTKRGIELASARSSWSFQEVKARGGRTGTRKEYAVSALPAEARQALMERQIATPVVSSATTSLVAASPAAPTSPTLAGLLLPKVQPSASLTDKQREGRDARKAVLAAIERLQATAGCGREPAMTTLLTTARAGRLEPALDAMLRMARDPRGRAGDGYPSIRTLKRWLSAPDLAPRTTQKDMTVPPWAPALMKLYARPQKPSLSACMDDLPAELPAGVEVPSYHAARRFLDKMGNVERNRGRMMSREIKTLMPFVRRDASEMTPDAIYTADGHTFDAEVAHPRHGRAFRPEITTVVSVPTRRCVGWSAGLAEGTWAVMDALRNAVETGGIPLIWYVDNGCGFKNAAMTNEVTGFVEGKLGARIENSLPYNSQARGVEERSHKSIWVRAAKKLPTYMGADMDRQARQKVFKLTRADLRTSGTSQLLMAWERFMEFCQAEIDAYNNRPHRSLPKTRDPETGKPRHMTPNEAWAKAVADGWQPTMPEASEMADLFRPEQICTTTRGEVRLNNHLYFSRDLAEFTGEKVRVGYDIHDASRVWVRDMDGRLIAIAGFEANKRAYFPESVLEQAQRKRTEKRLERLELHAEEARLELSAPALLEHQPAITIPTHVPGSDMLAERVVEPQEIEHVANVLTLPGVEARPMFRADPEQYRWLMRNPAQWDQLDALWLLDYVVSDDYLDLQERYEFQGVAWGNDDEERAKSLIDSEVAAR